MIRVAPGVGRRRVECGFEVPPAVSKALPFELLIQDDSFR